MVGNVADLDARRLRDKPDIVVHASIRGVHQPGGWTHYEVIVDGEPDENRAAAILRAAASILTDPESTDISGVYSG